MLSKVEVRIKSKKRKTCVLKNASVLYYELINMYKKEYDPLFEIQDQNWRRKHDYENLKDLNYQVDKVDKVHVTEKDEDKTDQGLPPWVKVIKSRLDEIKDMIFEGKNCGLSTKIEKRIITMKNSEELLESTISEKIGKKEAR